MNRLEGFTAQRLVGGLAGAVGLALARELVLEADFIVSQFGGSIGASARPALDQILDGAESCINPATGETTVRVGMDILVGAGAGGGRCDQGQCPGYHRNQPESDKRC